MRTPFLPFLVVGGLELVAAGALPAWAAWLPAWAGASTLWVSAAYALHRPGMLGKGTVPATLALLPFLLAARASARVVRRLLHPWRVELVPGLWVGAWPTRGVPGMAQLDLTAELPRRGEALRYRAVPMLDGAPPRPEDWLAAVEQVRAWREEGLPVLVHCAYGHGRSVSVCIGALLVEGRFARWEDAHAHVLRLRPRARMTEAQRRMLDDVVRRLSRPQGAGGHAPPQRPPDRAG